MITGGHRLLQYRHQPAGRSSSRPPEPFSRRQQIPCSVRHAYCLASQRRLNQSVVYMERDINATIKGVLINEQHITIKWVIKCSYHEAA